MEYRRFGDTLIVRIDPGEEIVEQVLSVAKREDIKLASVEALGAVNDFTVGVFNTVTKEYHANRFQGFYEIVSLTGTLSVKDGETYLHLHMSCGDEQGRVFGGHLNAATVSATCEMVIRVIDGRVERAMDPAVGLNLFRFL